MSMKVGLKGLCYSKVTTDTTTGTTYGTIVQIPGAVTADVKAAASVDTFFADNGPYEITTALGELSLDIEVADPSLTIMADILGHTVTELGVVHHNGDDTPPAIAIGFYGTKANGKKRFVWLLKGMFQEADDSYKTKDAKATPQSQKLAGKFTLRKSDNMWKLVMDEDGTGVLPAAVTAWFTEATINVPVIA